MICIPLEKLKRIFSVAVANWLRWLPNGLCIVVCFYAVHCDLTDDLRIKFPPPPTPSRRWRLGQMCTSHFLCISTQRERERRPSCSWQSSPLPPPPEHSARITTVIIIRSWAQCPVAQTCHSCPRDVNAARSFLQNIRGVSIRKRLNADFVPTWYLAYCLGSHTSACFLCSL